MGQSNIYFVRCLQAYVLAAEASTSMYSLRQKTSFTRQINKKR